jgi:hypothetical protein
LIVRSVDLQNDWLFGKGKNDYKSGLSSVQQSIRTRLQSFVGDCFFDSSAGVDWFTLLSSKNQKALKLSVATIILNTEFVSGILELDTIYDASTRNLKISYRVQTVYSEAVDIFQYTVGG